ncbi:MAG: hypothetical protein KAS23_12700 [Anaerohalosphaera sp.]|nr:hypothetical protein [Anaerohalosphaera sp.]
MMAHKFNTLKEEMKSESLEQAKAKSREMYTEICKESIEIHDKTAMPIEIQPKG